MKKITIPVCSDTLENIFLTGFIIFIMSAFALVEIAVITVSDDPLRYSILLLSTFHILFTYMLFDIWEKELPSINPFRCKC